jgi:ABC-type microcin C transport system duplicated ATPase subunit YejF
MGASPALGGPGSLAPRLRVVDVLETVLVVRRPIVSSRLRHNAMLVARDQVGVDERFAQVGAGIEIRFPAPRISFVVGVRL